MSFGGVQQILWLKKTATAIKRPDNKIQITGHQPQEKQRTIKVEINSKGKPKQKLCLFHNDVPPCLMTVRNNTIRKLKVKNVQFYL